GLAGAFAYVQGYATVMFIRTATKAQGILGKRLTYIAAGSGLLTFDFLLVAAGVLLPGLGPLARASSGLLGLVAGISYYVGFAPPGWLRRSWQTREFQTFLSRLAGPSPEDRLIAALDNTGQAAAAVLGARCGLVALTDDSRRTLRIHHTPVSTALLGSA